MSCVQNFQAEHKGTGQFQYLAGGKGWWVGVGVGPGYISDFEDILN